MAKNSQILQIRSQYVQRMKRISSSSSVSTITSKTKKNRKKKVTTITKQQFIDLITNHNQSLKDASDRLQVSYSTAKKIYSSFKKQFKDNISSPLNLQISIQTASFKQILSSQYTPIQVISKVGGKENILSQSPQIIC